MGNPEPVFVSRGVKVTDIRLIGATRKHLKLRLLDANGEALDAVAFNMADQYGKLKPDQPIDIAYTIDMNEWNGSKKLQLKVRDIYFRVE